MDFRGCRTQGERTLAYTSRTRCWCSTGRASKSLVVADERCTVDTVGELTEKCDKAKRDVGLRPPRCCQRRADVRNLRPVKGDERHSQAAIVAEQVVDGNVLWSDPAYPVEKAERYVVRLSASGVLRPRAAPHTLEQVAGYEIPAERAEEGEEEEPLSREATTLADSCVLLGMQRVEQRACHKVRWPNHRRWRNQEASRDAANGKADLWGAAIRNRDGPDRRDPYKLCRHHDHPLVPKAVNLVIVHALDRNDICLRRGSAGAKRDGNSRAYRIGRLIAHSRHHRDEDVFFHREGSRVEWDAKDFDTGHEPRPQPTERE